MAGTENDNIVFGFHGDAVPAESTLEPEAVITNMHWLAAICPRGLRFSHSFKKGADGFEILRIEAIQARVLAPNPGLGQHVEMVVILQDDNLPARIARFGEQCLQPLAV